MKIGYITFSSEEQELVHNVIQQMSQGAIDELGLGRIRDAFSDAMFPGMSTLHRKSKYFVLLPALYNQLAKRVIDDKKSITMLIREYEITMTISLLNGADGAADITGITGSSLGIGGLRAGNYVKITPTSIYLSSLKYFGLVDDSMNIIDLIYQESKYNREHGVIKRRTKDEITEDPDNTDITTGHRLNFYPFPGYDFSNEGRISTSLTAEEASILRSRIIQACKRNNNERDNLYSFLLSNDNIGIENDFFQMAYVINKLQEHDEIKQTYNLAYDFSRWAHVVNSYYRLAFYLGTGNNVRIDELRTHIQMLINNNMCPSSQRMSDIIKFINQSPDFHDVNGLCEFCRRASKLIDNRDEQGLINLIIERERCIKGSHYKIRNPRYQNTDFAGNAGYYTYRWNEIVYSMINDIRCPENG